MRATGIVRRMDDLGRIVIPKEVRRNMGLKEGDPIEIYTDKECICLKRYQPYGERDWEIAFKLAKTILPFKFALLDRYGSVQDYSCKDMVVDNLNYSKQIIIDGDCEGFIMAMQDEVDHDLIDQAAKVIATLFEGN